MADMGVEASETALHIYNTVDGAVAGYTGPLSNLGELECVTIQFQVECPAEFVGNTLIVDLYNYEPSYDNPEQEYHVVLQEGINNISIELLPGQTAPETGELRFFTVNTADYWIENVQVFEKIAQPKVTMPMTFAVVGTALLWLGTLLYGKFRKCRER